MVEPSSVSRNDCSMFGPPVFYCNGSRLFFFLCSNNGNPAYCNHAGFCFRFQRYMTSCKLYCSCRLNDDVIIARLFASTAGSLRRQNNQGTRGLSYIRTHVPVQTSNLHARYCTAMVPRPAPSRPARIMHESTATNEKTPHQNEHRKTGGVRERSQHLRLLERLPHATHKFYGRLLL